MIHSKSNYLAEGNVFIVPTKEQGFLACQIWMLDKKLKIADCGISKISLPVNEGFDKFDWADPKLYYGHVGILYEHIAHFGWQQIGRHKPAMTPWRDDHAMPMRLLYDLGIWRPRMLRFVSLQLFIDIVNESEAVARGKKPTDNPLVNGAFFLLESQPKAPKSG